MINNENKKLTEEEIEANKKRLEEAIGFARLGNSASISPTSMELFDKMVKGELTPEEVREKLHENYTKE